MSLTIQKNNLEKEFKKISKSQKRMHLHMILKAKTQETRKARINNLIAYLKNKKQV